MGISDHFLVYAVRKICIPKSNPKTVTRECLKDFVPASFRTDLSMVSWHLIEQEYNPDVAWDICQHMFLDIADYHALLKKKRVRGISSLLAPTHSYHFKENIRWYCYLKACKSFYTI